MRGLRFLIVAVRSGQRTLADLHRRVTEDMKCRGSNLIIVHKFLGSLGGKPHLVTLRT